MPAPAASVEVPRKRSRLKRVLAYFLIVVLTAILGFAGWIYAKVRSSLPQVDGTVAVRGLSAEVTVIRDAHGVPTIQATSFDDLFFAQGYVTAQDRLWEMDMMRRYAAGDLAEILGDGFVEHDREQRILGMRGAARKTILAGSTQDRARFEAYARGVNAYIGSHRGRLPLEFRMLGYAPHLWTPEDSGLIAAQMVKDLTHYNYRAVLAREKILAKVGPELTADLFVNSSSRDRLPTEARPVAPKASGDEEEDDDDSDPGNSVTEEKFSLPSLSAQVEDSEPSLLAGSNNWVVSGAHTVSGKPLLSNDMHLGHQMPNLWYEAHLRCGNFDVTGVTLPGFPYVVVGHNQRIAWGFTNLGATVEDLYIEKFDAGGKYLTPSGWQDAWHRTEVIHVKDKADVKVDVVLTRHGPIITSLLPGETRPIALRWTLYEGVRNPLFDVDAARNWQEFRQAFSSFDAPGQNVVYADVDGNIGYQATGKIPIRASGDGSLPENGSDDAHEWVGYIPFDKLPSIFNPPSGIIATANSRVTPAGYPYSISIGWEAPWRSERIYRVLESGKKFSPADMLALELDTHSECDKSAAERFVSAVDATGNASPRARQAADVMRRWDGRMTADSAAATIAYKSRTELARLLVEAKVGLDLNYRWGMQSIWLDNILKDRPPRWLPSGYANYDQLLAAAVENVVKAPDAPQDLSSWRWGNVNSLEIQHPVLGKIPVLQRWTGTGEQPQSGSGYCVRAATRTHGPSERMTVDFSNLDQSTLNIVSGQSGNFSSPNYLDQWKAWYEGYTFSLPFTDKAVESTAAHRLVLRSRD